MSQPLPRTPAPVVGTYQPPQIEHLRAVSRLLDSAFSIPGTRIRFGLDALIGLVPGIGDALGAVFSGYLIMQASRLGAPRSVINRMVTNIAIDTVIGWIPILGDLFDVGWKANNRNLALLEQYAHRPARARATSRWALLLMGAGLLVFLIAIVVVGVLVAQLFLSLFQS